MRSRERGSRSSGTSFLPLSANRPRRSAPPSSPVSASWAGSMRRPSPSSTAPRNGMSSCSTTSRRSKEKPMHLILFVLIGLIAGALAGRVVSGHGYGMLGDLVVGVVGAFLGGWFFAVAFGVVGGGFIVSLLTAFVGAVIMLWVIRLVAPSRA